MNFLKVLPRYISTIPRRKFSKLEAQASWYSDVFFSKKQKSVSEYSRIWKVQYNTAHAWVKEFCTNLDPKSTTQLLQDDYAETTELLKKISLLEQRLTDLKKEPLRNDYAETTELLHTTIRKNRKKDNNTIHAPGKSESKPSSGISHCPADFTPDATRKEKAKRLGIGDIELNLLVKEFIEYWTEGDGHMKKRANWQLTFGNMLGSGRRIPAAELASYESEAARIREDEAVKAAMAKIHAEKAKMQPIPGIKPVLSEDVFENWITEDDND